MCTAIHYKTKNTYFGRNLDLEYSYRETVTITPRNYRFHFRNQESIGSHYAMIGMAYVVDHYPLYYDATNEKGLSMAGLNFPDNAHYFSYREGMDNVAPFEFIPWILAQCATVAQARNKLNKINLIKQDYNKDLPLTPLHWMIADQKESIVVEPMEKGLRIYENPVGVLTNNPPFNYQLFSLNHYMNLSTEPAQNQFSQELKLAAYSRGMGAIGLPGDLSSSSRFVRASFVKMNAVSGDSEEESISQFFHMLGAVEQPRGCVHMGEGKYEITLYSSCCNVDKGVYYYTTYENRQITAVDMYQEDLLGENLIMHALVQTQQIKW